MDGKRRAFDDSYKSMKRYLITGASREIGRAIAELAGKDGELLFARTRHGGARANAQSCRAAMCEGDATDSRSRNERGHFRILSSEAGREPDRLAREQRRNRGSETIYRDHVDRMGATVGGMLLRRSC